MSDEFWSVLSRTSLSTRGLTQAMGSSGNTTRRTGEDNGLGKEAFLKLLLTQMQSQDPLSPMDGQDFFAQLAQFSVLEQMWNLNENLGRMQKQQQLLQASALIGRTVEIAGATGETISGVVKGIHVLNGDILVDVGDRQVPLDRIVAVRE